ncbi:MAG: hypothetical protein AAF732_22285 [Pseudomonadota bacterium]
MKFLMGVAVLILVFVISFSWLFEVYTWNQKVTISVDTPDGEKRGASVMRVSYDMSSDYFNSLAGRSGKFELTGEAAFVEVAPGRYLFVLLKGAKNWAWVAICDRCEATMTVRGPLIQNLKIPIDLLRLRYSYPTLVTFDDTNNPMTVREVDPNDLAATFGPGYALRSLTLGITKEPVTAGKVESVLAWLLGLNGGYLHGGSTSRGAPLGLYGGNFKVKER